MGIGATICIMGREHAAISSFSTLLPVAPLFGIRHALAEEQRFTADYACTGMRASRGAPLIGTPVTF